MHKRLYNWHGSCPQAHDNKRTKRQQKLCLCCLKKPKMYRLPPKPMYDYWRQQQWCSSSYSALMQMSEWLLSQMAPEIELAKKRSLLSSHNNTWWTLGRLISYAYMALTVKVTDDTWYYALNFRLLLDTCLYLSIRIKYLGTLCSDIFRRPQFFFEKSQSYF